MKTCLLFNHIATRSVSHPLISVSEPCPQASKPARQRVTLHWLLPASLQLSQGAVTIDFTSIHHTHGIQERRKFMFMNQSSSELCPLAKTFELFRAIYRTHKLKICTVYNFRCFRLHKATLLITNRSLYFCINKHDYSYSLFIKLVIASVKLLKICFEKSFIKADYTFSKDLKRILENSSWHPLLQLCP